MTTRMTIVVTYVPILSYVFLVIDARGITYWTRDGASLQSILSYANLFDDTNAY